MCMPTPSKSASTRGETFTERTRRAQLIAVTRDLIAENGYSGTSLQRIADAAGITKAAVLYYFPTKADVFFAAYDDVVSALVDDVRTAVAAAPPPAAPAAYIRAMIRHLKEHPRHVRVFAEAIEHGTRPYDHRERWRSLAELIEAAAHDRGETIRDARAVAIIIGGAIDGIITEQLDDPAFDSLEAGETLIAMLRPHLTAER